MKFEIQLRSILQHSWAEIEHKLGGYKTPTSVPRHIRRKFSRIAGLLELADEEFSAIRSALQSYAVDATETIGTRPDQIGIDAVSLKALLLLPATHTRKFAQTMVDTFRRPLDENVANNRLDDLVYLASLLELRTIEDIEQAVVHEQDTAISYMLEVSGGAITVNAIPIQWAVLYPLHVMLTRFPGKLYEYITHFKNPAHFDPHNFLQVMTAQVQRAAEKVRLSRRA